MGVEGSGARELLRSFAGLERTHRLDRARRRDAMSALRRLRSYVPATRAQSLYSNFSVGDNLLVRLGHARDRRRGLALKRAADEGAGAGRGEALPGQDADRPLQPIRSLSGGNQQKVAIAQALLCAPKLLLLEEPTRGVDIHSKGEIYRLLREYAGAGQ